MAQVEQRTIPQVIRAAERFGDREAFVDRDVRMTFSEFVSRIDRTARALIGSGVAHGDRVAVWAPNSWQWAVTAFAAHCVGAAIVPLNTRYKGFEARDFLDRSGATVLFTVNGFLGQDYVELLAAAGGAPGVRETIILHGPAPADTTTWERFQARADSVDPAIAAARADAVRPDDLTEIMFTSGTTGPSKGAMLMHGPSIQAFESYSDALDLGQEDRYLIIPPFFHVFGLKAGLLACVLRGATMIPMEVFEPDAVLRTITAERISVLPGPATVFQSILTRDDLDRYDLSSLRSSVVGAGMVPPQVIRDMHEVLGFERVLNGLGLTEAHGIVTLCRHDDPPEIVARTVGRPIPGVQTRLIDDDGNDVAPGTPGEVLVRGYNVMKGYIDDPGGTAAAIDADGWLHTGDIAVAQPDGVLTITDRKKDMFIVGGFNAYPAEIERFMLDHDDINQVAVVGVPDERLGEVGMAFVVRAPNATPTAEELHSWCRDRMANFKVPRYYEFIDALPLNAANKVVKYELRTRGADLITRTAERDTTAREAVTQP